MVSADIKNFEGPKLRNLIWDCAPNEIAADIQALQRHTLREMQRDGLVKQVISKVKAREVRKTTYRRRDFAGKIQTLQINRVDILRGNGGTSNSSPVAVMNGRSIGPV